MIIFIEEKHIDQCFEENKGIYIGVSNDLLGTRDWIADSSMLIPPPDVVMHYLSDGNKARFREEYYQYLSDPRIMFFLGLRIYQADKEDVFFCYSSMEKDMGYPKMLRQFIIDNLDMPKDFVVKFKNYNPEDRYKLKAKTYNRLMEFLNETKKKANEALDVMS